MATLDIKLKKVNKVYRDGEKIAGTVIVNGRGEVVHSGITLHLEGTVNMQLSAKSVGMFEAFYNSVKPISVVNSSLELVKPGKLPSGTTEIPFEVPIKALKNRTLFETYHGVFINIQYTIKCDMKRSLLNKDLQKSTEFIVEYQPQKIVDKGTQVAFSISPDSVMISRKNVRIPKFSIKGHIDTASCDILKPFTGEFVVENSEVAIKSIELQLVRVETCGCAEGYAKDATEIQNLQIADGDVCRNIAIPIYMIFPRLFTCPTTETPNFKIEFEANLVVVFVDDHLVTENFPIKLHR